MKPRHSILLAITALGMACQATLASDLSYTYLDFQAIQQTVEATGSQQPVFGQTVDILADDGDGVSVQGSLAIGERFYAVGSFATSIIDVSGVITNPLGVTEASDNFDLLAGRLGFGYIQSIGDTFDLIAQINFDSAELDFGSFAGEDFDVSDSGVGGTVGFRWNPTTQFELFSAAVFTQVGDPLLNQLEFDSDTRFNVGLRWYFIKDLALGLEFESGQIDTATLSLRFSFGKLDW